MAITCECLLWTGFNDNYDPKWGQFLPSQHLNVDQSPLPFAIDAKWTYNEHVKTGKGHKHNNWISTPCDGMTKWQCSLQVCFLPVNKLTIFFRGKRTRIHDVILTCIFPDSAWVDTQSFIEEDLGWYSLFCDNHTAQISDHFKEMLCLMGWCWYYISYTLKQLIRQAHHGLLDFDFNTDQWLGHEKSFTTMDITYTLEWGSME